MAFEEGSSSDTGEGAGSLQHVQDVSDVKDFPALDASESENEVDVPAAPEPVRGVRRGKRMYGIERDVNGILRRQERPMVLKNSKREEQLATLRSMVPAGTRRKEVGASMGVLLDAYQHIVKLRKRVHDLNTETASMALSASANLVESRELPQKAGLPAEVKVTDLLGSIDDISHELPMVEVKRVNRKLELQIACMNRGGLLLDILAALTSQRFYVVNGNIERQGKVLRGALSLENENLGIRASLERLSVEVDQDEALKQTILRVIRSNDNSK